LHWLPNRCLATELTQSIVASKKRHCISPLEQETSTRSSYCCSMALIRPSLDRTALLVRWHSWPINRQPSTRLPHTRRPSPRFHWRSAGQSRHRSDGLAENPMSRIWRATRYERLASRSVCVRYAALTGCVIAVNAGQVNPVRFRNLIEHDQDFNLELGTFAAAYVSRAALSLSLSL